MSKETTYSNVKYFIKYLYQILLADDWKRLSIVVRMIREDGDEYGASRKKIG